MISGGGLIMYSFSRDVEDKSRDTPACKRLDLGALPQRFSYGKQEEEVVVMVVVEMNRTSRENLADGSCSHNRRESHLSNGSYIYLGGKCLEENNL